MDKTLLTDDNQFPPGLWELVGRLNDAGIAFVPASGRPLLTLREMFDHPELDFTFISDNGAVVERGGEVIHQSVISSAAYMPVVETTLNKTGGVPVVCTTDGGYASKNGERFADQIGLYFRNLHFVDDLSELPSPAVKVSAYFDDLGARAALDSTYAPQHGADFAVTLGGEPWVDVTNKGVTKGEALILLGRSMGLHRSEMMAFGDALNDLSMLDAVEHSYAMANADPAVLKTARHVAPSNRDYGVVTVVEEVLAGR